MTGAGATPAPILVKLGGELLEEPSRLASVAAGLARLGSRLGAESPLVIVHGGGKEIDAALKVAGLEKRQVDGLRITDEATLDVVVAVIAGAVNTKFVAALHQAGVSAIGLTGADGPCGLCDVAPPHHAVDGRTVDLGRVGIPSDRSDARLLVALMFSGYVPVIACIGVTASGALLNVNADTLAGHVAARIGARRLVIAGTTAGVLDDAGATIDTLDSEGIKRLIGGGTATAGMIAKLRACEHALSHGVADVVIVDGRDREALEAAALSQVPQKATRLVGAAPRPALPGHRR